METLQNEPDVALPPADKVLFRKHVQRELDEIREEVEETCAVVDNTYPVPESAYDETLFLLEQMPHGVPLPDMMWLEDGGIGLEWRPGDGIVTMSLYGDNHLTFVAVLDDEHEIAGTCPLSDRLLLPNFLAILPNERHANITPFSGDRLTCQRIATKLARVSKLIMPPDEI